MVKASMLAIALTVAATPALADRGPSQGEATRIAQTLNAAGYKSWNKIEFTGSIWKVDDARKLNGKTYDVKISPTDYGIIKEDGD